MLSLLMNGMQGLWVEEVHQSFADWITQVVRVYKGIPGVELEYTVGPIPIKYMYMSITRNVTHH